MNLTRIRLITPYGGDVGVTDYVHLDLLIRDVTPNDQYILKAAGGFGADDIFSESAGWFVNPFTLDITHNYNNMVLKDRVITLLIDLNPEYGENQSAGDLRDRVYRAISYNRRKELELRLFVLNEDGTEEVGHANVYGAITKVDSNLFTDDPELQITFKCSDPMIRGFVGSAIGPSDPGYNAMNHTVTVTDNLSTAPHGFRMTYQTTEATDVFSVYTNDNEGFNVDFDFPDNSVIIFNSDYKNKELYTFPADSFPTITHLMDKIRPGSIWPMLMPGETVIKPYAPFVPPSGDIVSIEYKEAYWGV